MKHILLLVSGLLLVQWLGANNITVSNTSLSANPDEGIAVTFDLSWDNSWYLPDEAPNNYDAAWVFVKYRINGGDWQHLPIDATGPPPSPSTLEIKDGRGVMVYQTATSGRGSANYVGIELISSSSASTFSLADLVDVRVFGIEMVYVPEGSFQVGNNKGSFEDKETWVFRAGGSNAQGFAVTSEGRLEVGDVTGRIMYNPGKSGDDTGPIPGTFPKGFAAFYCMKYEMSQAQWVAFFNTLTATQKAARDITSSSGKNDDGVVFRNGVAYTSGDATTTRPHVPMGYLSHYDALAYLDWACLRPMSELEYEKAARGPGTPIVSGFTWGTNVIKTNGPYQLLNGGQPDEEISAATFLTTGNAVHGGNVDGDTDGGQATHSSGPLRVGIFAASNGGNNTQAGSGASYYGIMELSGNQAEGAYNLGTPNGRAFTGEHGDGILTAAGRANVTGWSVGNALGLKGGWYASDWTFAMIADRTWIANNPKTGANDTDDPAQRLPYVQFRGIRE